SEQCICAAVSSSLKSLLVTGLRKLPGFKCGGRAGVADNVGSEYISPLDILGESFVVGPVVGSCLHALSLDRPNRIMGSGEDSMRDQETDLWRGVLGGPFSGIPNYARSASIADLGGRRRMVAEAERRFSRFGDRAARGQECQVRFDGSTRSG